jgi:hypothetical protein
LSNDFRAAASSVKSLVCVCPAVPARPNVTVCAEPSSSIFQNLLEVPSEKTRLRDAFADDMERSRLRIKRKGRSDVAVMLS